MKMRSYNFCHTNTKNPGNNLGIFCLITGRPKLNGYINFQASLQFLKLSFVQIKKEFVTLQLVTNWTLSTSSMINHINI